MKTGIIKSGYGFNVGQNFARTVRDTPITITREDGPNVYGTIAGDPSSPLAFLRSPVVEVSVRKTALWR